MALIHSTENSNNKMRDAATRLPGIARPRIVPGLARAGAQGRNAGRAQVNARLIREGLRDLAQLR